MTKAIPTIQKYMTTAPHSIGAEQTLAHAHEVLREHKIRHLPVLKGGALVGMITQRGPRARRDAQGRGSQDGSCRRRDEHIALHGGT